jgi:hypothetical protein
MTSLVLFIGKLVNCQRVDDLLNAPEAAECVSLASCSSICLLRGETEKSALLSQDLVVLSSGEQNIRLGKNGVTCWSYQSPHVLEKILDSDLVCEALVSDIDGVLDEGLVIGEDFSVDSALPIRDLSGLDRVFLASANNSVEGFWCYRVGLRKNALLRLLDSATMGYLFGVLMTLPNGAKFRLVRCAGYNDAETDLILISGVAVLPSAGILAAF